MKNRVGRFAQLVVLWEVHTKVDTYTSQQRTHTLPSNGFIDLSLYTPKAPHPHDAVISLLSAVRTLAGDKKDSASRLFLLKTQQIKRPYVQRIMALKTQSA